LFHIVDYLTRAWVNVEIGQLLAIAWSDGSVRLVGAESTKVVHQFSTGDISGVTCMGWASNLTSKKRSKIGSKMAPETLEDVLIKDGIFPENQTPVDLPRDLSLIDIETSLPKLSVLAAGGSS
jgi:anaphase-promoting complex subunit 4